MKNDIEISHVFKSFGNKEVLKDFSATLEKGSATALMAPSGGGKTTLLRILMGLEKMDSGEIRGLEGVKISAVFQEDRLCPYLSAKDNIRLADSEITSKEAEKALNDVGLKDSVNQKAEELSGGMKRRVAILRALLASCDLLLLDEPFKGLDEDTKKLVMEDTLKRMKGKTVLLVTHDKEEADFLGIKKILYI